MSGQLDELKASHQEQPTFFFLISIAKFTFVFVSVYVSVNVLLIIAEAFWCTRCDRDGKKGTTGDWQEKLRFAWVGSLSNVE